MLGKRVHVLWTLLLLGLAGCGTTRVTDTSRTATEQLLISNAVDQAVSEIDVRQMTGQKVFFDPQFLDGVVDRGYLVSSLRQHLAANGCLLQEDRAKATYVVEARAGAVGTDRHDLLVGVPQVNIPTIIPGQPGGLVPEIPLAKRVNKKGIAKIALFAFHRDTGQPIMQTGIIQTMSSAKDYWVLGAGPYEKGTLREGAGTHGRRVQMPLREDDTVANLPPSVVPVTQRAVWVVPNHPKDTELAVQPPPPPHTDLAKPPPPIPEVITPPPPPLIDSKVLPASAPPSPSPER